MTEERGNIFGMVACAIFVVLAVFVGAFLQGYLTQDIRDSEYQRGFSEGYENGYSNACIAVNSGYGVFSCGSVWATQKEHAMQQGGIYYDGSLNSQAFLTGGLPEGCYENNTGYDPNDLVMHFTCPKGTSL